MPNETKDLGSVVGKEGVRGPGPVLPLVYTGESDRYVVSLSKNYVGQIIINRSGHEVIFSHEGKPGVTQGILRNTNAFQFTSITATEFTTIQMLNLDGQAGASSSRIYGIVDDIPWASGDFGGNGEYKLGDYLFNAADRDLVIYGEQVIKPGEIGFLDRPIPTWVKTGTLRGEKGDDGQDAVLPAFPVISRYDRINLTQLGGGPSAQIWGYDAMFVCRDDTVLVGCGLSYGSTGGVTTMGFGRRDRISSSGAYFKWFVMEPLSKPLKIGCSHSMTATETSDGNEFVFIGEYRDNGTLGNWNLWNTARQAPMFGPEGISTPYTGVYYSGDTMVDVSAWGREGYGIGIRGRFILGHVDQLKFDTFAYVDIHTRTYGLLNTFPIAAPAAGTITSGMAKVMDKYVVMCSRSLGSSTAEDENGYILVYDYDSHTIRRVSNLIRRVRSGAITVGNKVIIGSAKSVSSDYSNSNTVDIFDAETNTAKCIDLGTRYDASWGVEVAPYEPSMRYAGNDKVFMGHGHYSDTVGILDLKTERMMVYVCGNSAAWGYMGSSIRIGNKVVFGAGYSGSGSGAQRVIVYDSDTDTFTRSMDLPARNWGAKGAMCIAGDCVCIGEGETSGPPFGGYVLVYNTRRNDFKLHTLEAGYNYGGQYSCVGWGTTAILRPGSQPGPGFLHFDAVSESFYTIGSHQNNSWGYRSSVVTKQGSVFMGYAHSTETVLSYEQLEALSVP